jgi:hypothetical protein
MRSDKAIAIKLRQKGNSYGQISVLLKVPKSTLSNWLKDLKISQEAENKIRTRTNETAIKSLIERNHNQTREAELRHQKIRVQAKEEAKKLLSDDLFLTGLSLYWAEGYKQGAYGSKWKSLDFANSDPEMISIMVKFFRKFLDLRNSDIRIQIMLHNPVDSKSAINFWHDLTKIPKKNFIKTCTSLSRASLQKRGNKLKYGTIHLRVNDVSRFFRLIGWLDGLKEKFI